MTWPNTATNPVSIGGSTKKSQFDLVWDALSFLSNGAANLKLFMNAAATAPEWAAGIKLIQYTKDLSTTGDISYTGAGFRPKAIILLGINTGAFPTMGYADFVNPDTSISQYGATTWYGETSRCIGFWENASSYCRGASKSADVDGCTITWSKGGTPIVTCSFSILFIR